LVRVTAFENNTFIQPIPPLRGDEGGCNKILIFQTNVFIENRRTPPQAPLKGGIEKVDIPNAVTLLIWWFGVDSVFLFW